MRARRIKLDAEPVSHANADGVIVARITTGGLILHVLTVALVFNKDLRGARAAERILNEARRAEAAKKPADLEPDDWELLKGYLEKPQPLEGCSPYPGNPVLRFVPMIDNIVNAPEVEITAADEKSNGKPKPKEKTAAEA